MYRGAVGILSGGLGFTACYMDGLGTEVQDEIGMRDLEGGVETTRYGDFAF